MRITIYNSKGSVGKTPISTNISLEKDFCIASNSIYSDSTEYLLNADDKRFVKVSPEEKFPESIKKLDIDTIFDLAGFISEKAHSITSALDMSDCVIVPITHSPRIIDKFLIEAIKENSSQKINKILSESFKKGYPRSIKEGLETINQIQNINNNHKKLILRL